MLSNKHTSKIPPPTLSEMFPGADFVRNDGGIVLRALAERYPDMEYDADANAVTFRTEDMLFEIRADIKVRKRTTVVFIGTITSFCPTTIEFSTGYLTDLYEVVKALQAGWLNIASSNV